MAQESRIVITPEETHALAKDLLQRFGKGKLWYLKGPLGSGKTEFIKGLYWALGGDPREVSSPSFSIVHVYPGLIHIDLYRIPKIHEQDLEDLGLWDALTSDDTRVVEWPPDDLQNIFPPDITLSFAYVTGGRRQITWSFLKA